MTTNERNSVRLLRFTREDGRYISVCRNYEVIHLGHGAEWIGADLRNDEETPVMQTKTEVVEFIERHWVGS